MDSPAGHSRGGLYGLKKQDNKTTDKNSVNIAAVFIYFWAVNVTACWILHNCPPVLNRADFLRGFINFIKIGNNYSNSTLKQPHVILNEVKNP